MFVRRQLCALPQKSCGSSRWVVLLHPKHTLGQKCYGRIAKAIINIQPAVRVRYPKRDAWELVLDINMLEFSDR